MAADTHFFVYAGQYPDLAEAQRDFDDLIRAHRDRTVGRYDAALFTKECDGHVKIIKTKNTGTVVGAWTGGVLGAVLGLIFPAGLVVAAGGAALGAFIGHVSTGMSRADIKDLGELLDDCEAGVVLIAEAKQEPSDILKHATRATERLVTVDESRFGDVIDGPIW